MKRLTLIICIAVLALAQTPVRHGEMRVTADWQEHNGSVRHLIGHVKIETDAMIVQADDVNYDEDSQEIGAHGDVHVKLK